MWAIPKAAKNIFHNRKLILKRLASSSSKSNVWFEMVREIGAWLVGNPQGSIRHFLQKQKLTKSWFGHRVTHAIVHFFHKDMEIFLYSYIFGAKIVQKVCNYASDALIS